MVMYRDASDNEQPQEEDNTRQFIITIADGKSEYALSLDSGERVDLSDYTCRAVTKKDLPKLKACEIDAPAYEAMEELLHQGLELHIWRRRGH